MYNWLGMLLACFCVNAGALQVQKPFFYKISVPRGKPSYILGTIHTGLRISDFPTGLGTAVSTARLVLFENFGTGKPEGSTPLNQKVRDELKTLGYSDSELDDIQDENCTRVALGIIRFKQKSVDQELYDLAKKSKIETDALEPQPLPAPQCRLSELQRKPGALKEWRTQFNLGLDRLLRQYTSGEPGTEFTSDLDEVRERNKLWMPKLVTELQKGNVLVIVGVAHLYGYSGLIELLKDRGYKIERDVIP